MESYKACMLLDFYGNLLTPKMRHTLELYQFNDLSLAEIADSESISRQGVYDTVKRAIRTLEEYEDKLKLIDRFEKQKDDIALAISKIDNGQILEARDILSKIDAELESE